MLKFSVQTPDLGEATDELAVRYTGDPLDIGFNANYLLEILRYIPTDEVTADVQGAGARRDAGAGRLDRSGAVSLPRDAAALGRLTATGSRG